MANIVEIVTRLTKNKDSKALIENFFSLTVFQFLTMFLPIITLPYLMEVIGTEKYGIIVLANSLIMYFMTFTEFSFGISATRDIAIHRNNKASINLIYSRVFSSQCLILLLSLVVYLLIILLIPKFKNEIFVYIFAFLNLVGRVLTPDWFFQGMERMKYITFFNALTRLIFVSCIFLFIKNKDDYYLHPLFLGLGSILGGIVSQYIIYKQFKVRFKFVGFVRIKNTLTDNFALFTNQLLPQLYNNSTTFILGMMTSNAAVGLYGSLKQIVDFLVTIVRIISRVFFPFLTRKPVYFEKFSMLFFAGSCILISPFLFGINYILDFFNIVGQDGSSVLIILLIGVPLLTLYETFGTNYFLSRRMDRIVVRNTLFSSLIGIICSLPLILSLGALGAALNLTMCRGMMGIGLAFRYRKK